MPRRQYCAAETRLDFHLSLPQIISDYNAVNLDSDNNNDDSNSSNMSSPSAVLPDGPVTCTASVGGGKCGESDAQVRQRQAAVIWGLSMTRMIQAVKGKVP